MDSIESRLNQLLELSNAHLIEHSGRTLYEHLINTAAIARSVADDDNVVLACSCHSIYGTQFFKHQCLNDDMRPIVKDVIGDYAESLVWFFCKAFRPFEINKDKKFYKIKTSIGEMTITKKQVIDLYFMETCNLMEQRIAKGKNNEN